MFNDYIYVVDKKSSAVYVYDKNHKLVMGNKIAREIQTKWGFDLKPGVDRKDMLENVKKKGLIKITEGMTSDENYKKRINLAKTNKNYIWLKRNQIFN